MKGTASQGKSDSVAEVKEVTGWRSGQGPGDGGLYTPCEEFGLCPEDSMGGVGAF